MATVTISWNIGGWNVESVNRGVIRALSRAGSDAAKVMRTDAGRQIRDRKRFKASYVRAGTPLDFPASKSSIDALVWTMRVSGAPVPVSSLSPRQTKKGVTFAINRGRRSLIRGGFIATTRSGHTGVFVRRGKSRLPIDEAFTSRLSDVMLDRGLIPSVYARTSSTFKSAFARLIQVELSKK